MNYATYIAENINFNPNDGVTTELILNTTEGLPTPDYLIAAEQDGFRTINSRWFVIEAQRTRALQTRLTLYRDLVADHLEQIIDAPMFVEKATLTASNPLIYNSEDISVNQIKTAEHLLKDKTDCPWIVGYLPRDTSNITARFTASFTPDIEVDSIQGWEWYDYAMDRRSLYSSIDEVNFNVYAQAPYINDGNYGQYIARFSFGDNPPDKTFDTILADSLTNAYEYWTEASINTSLSYNNSPGSWVYATTFQNVYKTQDYKSRIEPEYAYYIPNATFSSTGPYHLNDQYIYDRSTQKLYKIKVKTRTDSGKILIESGSVFNLLSQLVAEGTAKYGKTLGTPNDSSFSSNYTATQCFIDLTEVNAGSYYIHLKAGSERPHLLDAPYDMFCLPYTNDLIYKTAPDTTYPTSKDINLGAALALATASGGSIWDLQLLPYCPIAAAVTDNTIDVTQLTYDHIFVDEGGAVFTKSKGIIIWCTQSTFSFDIPFTINNPTSGVDAKVGVVCDNYRLNSPNYSGAFDFNAVKNGGVQWINVDCQYKPFQPYIHLNPNFGGLYGTDYDDARGLICGGDFSLPILSDAWEQYELQNKNYQKQFDRQIQNMEIQHKYQQAESIFNAITGTISGAAGGARTGGMMAGGHPAGAIVGGVVGGVASAAGGVTDVIIGNNLRKEAIDYSKDQFGYQLDNIKALPESLTRVSAFNNNNKVFPFIEYYTCTDTEKEAVRNKIKYNGMSVGVIGTLRKYLQPTESYIKGKLIRLDAIESSFEVANALSNELNKGVFIDEYSI